MKFEQEIFLIPRVFLKNAPKTSNKSIPKKIRDFIVEVPSSCPQCNGEVKRDFTTLEFFCSKCGLVL